MKYERKPEPKIDIPIVNIGDIAFLLIIFFIMTSTFMRESYIKLTIPKSPDIRKMKEAPVGVVLDSKGLLWLQGTSCSLANLEPGVNALLMDKKEKIVTLKIDKALSQREYGPVLMALSKAGAEVALIGTQTGQ